MGIESLIDLGRIASIARKDYEETGLPFGLIDADTGEVYINIGWQRICRDFHRRNPESCVRCIESDTAVKDNLPGKSSYSYKCGNGMWDIGVPVYINGVYSLTIFIGQFFYEGEHPDREYFIRQGEMFGYDLDDYLKALDEVPVFSRDKVEEKLERNRKLADEISAEAARALKG